MNRRLFAGGGLVAVLTALTEMGVVTAQSQNGGQCAVCRTNTDCSSIGCVGGVCAPQSTVCGGQAFDTSCQGLKHSKYYECRGNSALCCRRNGRNCRRARNLCG